MAKAWRVSFLYTKYIIKWCNIYSCSMRFPDDCYDSLILVAYFLVEIQHIPCTWIQVNKLREAELSWTPNKSSETPLNCNTINRCRWKLFCFGSRYPPIWFNNTITHVLRFLNEISSIEFNILKRIWTGFFYCSRLISLFTSQ